MRPGWTKTSAGLSDSGAARTTVRQVRPSTSVQCGGVVLWRQSSGCATVSEAVRVRASRTHATGDAGQRHACRSVSGGGACCVTDSCTATDTFRQGQYSRICVLPPPLPVNRAMRTTTAKKSHSLKRKKKEGKETKGCSWHFGFFHPLPIHLMPFMTTATTTNVMSLC